jgi:hypothetical protein
MSRYAKILGINASEGGDKDKAVYGKTACTNVNAKERNRIPDPRPDLAEDSALWSLLLNLARETNPQLAANLHGLRCEGTRLRRSAKWGLAMEQILPGDEVEVDAGGGEGRVKIKATDGITGWQNREDYQAAAQEYLRPYHKELLELFRKIG